MKAIRILPMALLLLISYQSYSTTHIIQQSGYTFSPATLNVTVGDIVRWEWSAGSHTTTSKVIPSGAAAWDSPLTSTTTSFEYTVTVEGVYNYVCTPHESMGMKGSFTATTGTGVNENKSLVFTIYPNPVTSFINIKAGLEGNVVLSDILGKNIKEFRLNELPFISDSYQLDLSDLKNGIYIVTFISLDTQKQISLKFIKK